MKVWIGEYGRLIVLTILTVMLTSYMFSRSDGGMLRELSQAAPKGTLKEADNFHKLKEQSDREPPLLSVKTKKLTAGSNYDLLDKELFGIQAEDADGNASLVSVIKIMTPEGVDITDAVIPESFVPDMQGAYHITYQALDTSTRSSGKTTVKTYCFAAA